jgi:hypothetical protein
MQRSRSCWQCCEPPMMMGAATSAGELLARVQVHRARAQDTRAQGTGHRTRVQVHRTVVQVHRTQALQHHCCAGSRTCTPGRHLTRGGAARASQHLLRSSSWTPSCLLEHLMMWQPSPVQGLRFFLPGAARHSEAGCLCAAGTPCFMQLWMQATSTSTCS